MKMRSHFSLILVAKLQDFFFFSLKQGGPYFVCGTVLNGSIVDLQDQMLD